MIRALCLTLLLSGCASAGKACHFAVFLPVPLGVALTAACLAEDDEEDDTDDESEGVDV
jgi:hypothetical protein